MRRLREVSQFAVSNQGSLFPVLDMLGFGVLYVYLVVAGNWLTPMEFGQLNSLAALSAFLGAIGIAIQYMVARRLAKHGHRTPVGDLLIVCTGASVGIGAVCMVPLPRQLQLDAVWLVGAPTVAALVVLNAQIAFLRGVAQGQERFLVLWTSQMAAHVTRLLLFVVLSLGGATLLVAWWALLLAEVVHFVVVLAFVAPARWRPCLERGPVSLSHRMMEVARIGGANLGLNFLLSVDLVLAAEFLGDESGTFATANRFGRLLFHVSASLAIVLLPTFAKRRISRRVIFGACLLGLALTPLLAGLGAGLTRPVIRWFFPAALVPSFSLTTWEFGANLGLAACQILATWHIARERRWYAWILAGCGVATVTILALGPATAEFYAQSTACLFWGAAVLMSWVDVPVEVEPHDPDGEAEESPA